MATLPILRWPDARLTTPCAAVGAIDGAIRTLAADMLETMYAAPGRGLAAPQVGRLLRLFVMDTAWKDGPRSPRVMINPDILELSQDREIGAEACLSLPGTTTFVERATEIRMSWTDLDGRNCSGTMSGFDAICVQHEYDHLDGLLTLDRLTPADRARAEAALQA